MVVCQVDRFRSLALLGSSYDFARYSLAQAGLFVAYRIGEIRRATRIARC